MRRNVVRSVLGRAAMVGALMLGGAQASLAQTNAVASGDWSDPLTWNPAEPVAGTTANINGSFTVAVTQAGETANFLDLGTIAAQTGNLTVADPGDLSVGTLLRVGQAAGSTGNLTMTGGSVTVNGAPDSGIGNGELIVGDVGATGTASISGGLLSTADEIFIGLGAGSNGTVNVSGGTLQTGRLIPPTPPLPNGRSIIVGFDGGTGALNVSGGLVRTNFDLLVGLGVGSNGSVTVSGGTIDTGFVFTNAFTGGAGSTSTVTQTGGTISARIAYVLGQGNGSTTNNHSGGTIDVLNNGEFVVGDGAGNSSTYNISGTADVNIARNLVAGRDGVGVINMTGGTIDAANVFLGDFDSSSGTLNISGGVLTLSGNLNVGGALASNAATNPPGFALDANGTLIVSGTGGAIDVGGNLLANPLDNPRVGGGGERNSAMLVFEVTSGGVSIVDAAGIADLTGAEIDVDLLSAFPLGSTFDLITATDISTDYLQVAEDLGRISLAIVGGGNGEILRATVVPEPVTLALAACGILTLIVRSRRKG